MIEASWNPEPLIKWLKEEIERLKAELARWQRPCEEVESLVFFHHYEGQNDGPAEVVVAEVARRLAAQLRSETETRNALEGDRTELQAKVGHLEQQLADLSMRLCSLENDNNKLREQLANALTVACKPWQYCTGEPPDWESPLQSVWQAAICWCQELVAKSYKIDHYESDGASETLEGDTMVGFTSIIRQIVEREQLAAKSASPEQAALEQCISEALQPTKNIIATYDPPNPNAPLHDQVFAVLQRFEAMLAAKSGNQPCCGKFETCLLPCTPRGRWLAEQDAKPRNLLKIDTSEWETVREKGVVTVHHRLVGGVLCRWWGDGETPPGVAQINAAVDSAKSGSVPIVDRELLVKVCEGVRRAVESGALDARSMAADACLIIEAQIADKDKYTVSNTLLGTEKGLTPIGEHIAQLERALAKYEQAKMPEEAIHFDTGDDELELAGYQWVDKEDYDALRTFATAEHVRAEENETLLNWVQQHDMALIPPEHGGHGWMVVQRARAAGGRYIASSENPRHDSQSLRNAIKKAIAELTAEQVTAIRALQGKE